MKICRDCANVMGDDAVNCLRCKSTNLASVQEKICTYCKTRIAVGTIICPHCHRVLPPESQAVAEGNLTSMTANPIPVAEKNVSVNNDMQNPLFGGGFVENYQPQGQSRLYNQEVSQNQKQNSQVVPIIIPVKKQGEQGVEFVSVQGMAVQSVPLQESNAKVGQNMQVANLAQNGENYVAAEENLQGIQDQNDGSIFITAPYQEIKKYPSATQYVLPQEQETANNNQAELVSSENFDMDQDLLAKTSKKRKFNVINNQEEEFEEVVQPRNALGNEAISRTEPKEKNPYVPMILFGSILVYILIALFTPYMNHSWSTIAGYEMCATVMPSLRDVFYSEYANILYGTKLLASYEFVGSYLPFSLNIGIMAAIIGGIAMMISALPKWISATFNIFAFFCQLVCTVTMCFLFGVGVISVSSILFPVCSLALVIAHLKLS